MSDDVQLLSGTLSQCFRGLFLVCFLVAFVWFCFLLCVVLFGFVSAGFPVE